MINVENHPRLTRSNVLVAVGLLLFVAACGSSDRVASGINSLGAVFVKAFQTDPNGDPLADPTKANLVVNPRIEPFNP